MSQLFPPAFDLAAKFVIGGVVLAVVGGAWAFYSLNRSSYWTRVGVTVNQPVPFSHQHHVGELGIDCRFCHSSVTTSADAGMPDTQTCMTCHSQIWKDAPMLAPVRKSYADNRPIEWNRVNEMPGFVYFNHSIHINKGVGCSTLPRAAGRDADHLEVGGYGDGVVPEVPPPSRTRTCGR